MLAELKAESDIRGSRLNLAWTWVSAHDERPNLRLVRRQRAYPADVEDGLSVVALTDLFRWQDIPWARIEATLYLVANAVTEGGMRQATVCRYYDASAADQPVRMTLAYYDTAAGAMQMIAIPEVSRVETNAVAAAPWDQVETLEIFTAPAGGPEQPWGQVVASAGHADGVTPNRLQWFPAGVAPAGVTFDRRETQLTTTTVLTAAPGVFQSEARVVRDGVELHNVTLDELLDQDKGEWRRSVRVADMGLVAETPYYYALFAPHATFPEIFVSERQWRVCAPATGHYRLEDRLYDLLPALHQQYDEPTRDTLGQGQLRRLLQVFGLTADHILGLSEGLRDRHDLLNVHAGRLPHLARWIGWEPDRTLEVAAQRSDILFAPEIYATVGTIPNIRALVNRITGWDCKVKEFVHNVMLTNAPERIRLWELWELRREDGGWSAPSAVTHTDGFDGRPAAAVDGNGVVWLFWHANRGGRREIWLQRSDGLDAKPRRAMFNAPDDAPSLAYTDEYPATVAVGTRVWLFWNSDRGGQWDIWGRTYIGLAGGAPVRLTDHHAADRCPAAVVDGSGRIWLFWESVRRGQTDIWMRRHDGSEWGQLSRLTGTEWGDRMPAAVVDGTGNILLFWSADQGDRSAIYTQVYDGVAWGAPAAVTDGPYRDESPSAAFRDDRLWLFWHSNRGGGWQVWEQSHNGTDWSNPGKDWSNPVSLTGHIVGDKEPAAVVDGAGRLRLFWRSRRRGRRYQSRTLVTKGPEKDPEAMSGSDTFADRLHYTYDTGRDDTRDWYARDTVGLYVTPDTDDPALIIRGRRPLEVVQRFLPIQVRAVLVIEPTVHKEPIYSYDFPAAEPQRRIGEQAFDSLLTEYYPGLTDGYRDIAPGWTWLRTWSPATPAHLTVDTDASPIDTSSRIWHRGLIPGG